MAKAVRAAALLFGRHGHEISRYHQRQEIVLQDNRTMNRSSANRVVCFEINPPAETRPQYIAIEFLRLSQIVHTDGAVTQTFDIRHVSSLISPDSCGYETKRIPRLRHRTAHRKPQEQPGPDCSLCARESSSCPR